MSLKKLNRGNFSMEIMQGFKSWNTFFEMYFLRSLPLKRHHPVKYIRGYIKESQYGSGETRRRERGCRMFLFATFYSVMCTLVVEVLGKGRYPFHFTKTNLCLMVTRPELRGTTSFTIWKKSSFFHDPIYNSGSKIQLFPLNKNKKHFGVVVSSRGWW